MPDVWDQLSTKLGSPKSVPAKAVPTLVRISVMLLPCQAV